MLIQTDNATMTLGTSNRQVARKRGRTLAISCLAASILFAGVLPPLQAHISSQAGGEKAQLTPSPNAARHASQATGQLAREMARASRPAPVAAAVLNFGLLATVKESDNATAKAEAFPAASIPDTSSGPDQAGQEDPTEAVKRVVHSWAEAWSKRDVEAYLAAYGGDFTPDKGVARSAWVQSRRQKIEGRKSISVAIRDLRVESLSDDRMEARFLQDYTADDFQESGTQKLLLLAQEGGHWRILVETTGKAQVARK